MLFIFNKRGHSLWLCTFFLPSIPLNAALLACVAWPFWLLSNKGGRGQKNREEIGAGKPPCYAGYRFIRPGRIHLLRNKKERFKEKALEKVRMEKVFQNKLVVLIKMRFAFTFVLKLS